jgi:hypothetical protein
MLNLLSKLASLKRSAYIVPLLLIAMRCGEIIDHLYMSSCRFSQLSLTGIKLNKLMVDKLCSLAQSMCASGFLLGGTSIGPVSLLSMSYD